MYTHLWIMAGRLKLPFGSTLVSALAGVVPTKRETKESNIMTAIELLPYATPAIGVGVWVMLRLCRRYGF